jgi:predicted Zn finger-like uncharacterized protein
LPVTARCPQCQTLYRIASEKIAPTGARLRCTRCKNVFRVEPPPAPQESAPAIASLERVAPEPPKPEPTVASERARALIAEADPSLAKRIADYLQRWQIDSCLVLGGGEALLGIFRSPPALAILGGHLPGVSAPTIVEVVRRSGGLADVHLVRIAPMGEPGGPLEFEADETFEPADLPEALGATLEALGIGERPALTPPPGSGITLEPPVAPQPAAPAPREPEPQPVEQPAPPLASEPSVPQATGASGEASPEIAAAERLARIAVSDIILYNEDKFRAAAAAGTLPDALTHEIEEARSLFRSRISDDVRAKRDFLVEELMARAARL